MAYGFNLKNKEIIDNLRSENVYQYNMACNLAMLSNDPSVIRRFFSVEIPRYFKDQWLAEGGADKFMAQYIPGQAFAYFGIIPMIVNGKVNLVASNGFVCKSNDEEIDEVLNDVKAEAELEQKFSQGVYWESGIGDFAYRVSVNKALSDKPIIDVIEPEHLEVNYKRGIISSFVIKEVAKEDPSVELREIHSKTEDGFVRIEYKYWTDGKYVLERDESLIKLCDEKFGGKRPEDVVLPFKEFLVIFKKNANNNQLYRGHRGVPDIQGLMSIEDALTETISDLIDAIRKGGVREYVSDQLIPQDENGNDLRLNHFNKTVITTKGSSTPGDSKNLWEVTQGQIYWEAYTRTIQNLMSVAINKAGLAPTTLGLTGLESINSSAESQDAREKTSLRTREIALTSWRKTLTDLLNRYLQVKDYMDGKPIVDYSGLINIEFNEYTSPSVENVTNVLAQQVQAGIKSRLSAIKELNDGFSQEQVDNEFLQIMAEKGKPVVENMESMNSIKNHNLESSDSSNANLENSDSV